MLSVKRGLVNFPTISSKVNQILASKHFSQSTAAAVKNESEFSETPEYPPCFDFSLHGRKRLAKQVWYDSIKALPTVQEKLLELCLDKDGQGKRWSRVCVLSSFPPHYNTLPLKLHCTRTHLKEGLPDVYDRVNVDALTEFIKPTVINAIIEAFARLPAIKRNVTAEGTISADRQRIQGQIITDSIYRAVTVLMSSQISHMRDCQVDYNPRCDAFWIAKRFPPSQYLKKIRRNTPKLGAVLPEDAPVDRAFQFFSVPYMQVRNTQPLPSFVDRDDPLCTTYSVPEYYYDTRTCGLPNSTRYPTSVPGFWPGDPCGFGSLSIITSEKIEKAVFLFGEDCIQELLHGCGVLHSFSWLTALAHYKGFSPFQEITYPSSTQTIITNGRQWSFYAYQLNTICLCENLNTNQYQNICWGTPAMNLFDSVENDQVIGYNDEVVKLFVKFLLRAPEEREGVNLTPYLRQAEHSNEKWAEICHKFKHYYANKPIERAHKPIPIPLWEKIYKIKFNAKFE